MDEQHKQPRILANLLQGRRKLPRRAALKGLSAIAVAAVGCGTDREEPMQSTTSSAGSGTAGPAPVSAAGSRAATTSSATATAGSHGSAGGTGAAPTGAATPPAAGTASVPTTGGAGATAPASSAAGGSATAGTSTAGSAAASGAGGVAGGASSAPALAALQCIATPAMTDGPFFVDEKLQRSDLIMGETEDAVVKACPLKLVIGVYKVDGMQCAPLAGATVDIWHANALGEYSDVASGIVQSIDTRGKKYLRGYQVTDELGVVHFETIYPGWYMSRTIHIHFKVRMPAATGGTRGTFEFTSQMFFDEAINAKVLTMAPYTSHPGQRSVLNDDDHIYNGTASNGQKPPAGKDAPGKSILPTLVADGSGYTATLKLGLRT